MEKTQGRYTDNKQAQRYIYQMAEEVMSQLSAVSAQIKRHENEPAVFQALLDEWNEAFPPGLAKVGSPKAVAALVTQQAAELTELRAALHSERASKEKDIADVLRSMDAQIQTSRNGIISERRQLSQLNKEEIASYQRAVLEEKAASRIAVASLQSKLDKQLASMKTISEQAVRQERAQIADIEKQHQKDRYEFQKEIQDMKSTFSNEKKGLKAEIKELINDKKRLSKQIEAIMNFDAGQVPSGMSGSGSGLGLDDDDDDDDSLEEISDEEEWIDEPMEESVMSIADTTINTLPDSDSESDSNDDDDDESASDLSDDEGGPVVSGMSSDFVGEYKNKKIAEGAQNMAVRLARQAEKREKALKKKIEREERRAVKVEARLQAKLARQAQREASSKRKLEERAARAEQRAQKEKQRAEAKEIHMQRQQEKARKKAEIMKERQEKAHRLLLASQAQSLSASAASANSNSGRNSGIAEFRNQIAELRQRLQDQESKYDEQQVALHKETSEKMSAIKQVASLTDMIDMMRQALQVQMAGGHADCHCENMVPNTQPLMKNCPVELTHTPHMLQRADKKGLLKNRKLENMGGWKSAGHY